MAVILIVLCCAIDSQKEQKLCSLNISLKKMAVALFVLLACGSIGLYVLRGDYQAWIYSDAHRAVLDYMAENDDKVFLAGDGGVFGLDVADSVWNHPGKRGIWNLIGNWETYSVPYLELMERQGIQYTLPGFPCVYYGDEAGMEGYRDPFNRCCYPWGKENKELIEWHKKLGNLRKSCSALWDGEFVNVYAKERRLEYIRHDDHSAIFCTFNLYALVVFKIIGQCLKQFGRRGF